MSARTPTRPDLRHAHGPAARTLCFVTGSAGLGLTAAAVLAGSAAAWRSYLIALVLFTGLSLGALTLASIHGITGGRWGELIRPELAAAAHALPVLALLFAVLLLGLDRVFPWAGAAVPGAVVRDAQRWYLNAPFFRLRALLFFAAWLALLFAAAPRRRAASTVGLIVLTLTTSLAAVDWIGSLLPQFYSTGFGLMVATGDVLAALAVALLTIAWRVAREPPSAGPALGGTLADLGKLQLTLVLAWGYLALMQFVTIWVADLPREIAWYLPRVTTSWLPLAPAVVALKFAVPFAVLLSPRARRNAGALAAVAGVLLCGHLLDTLWLVAPTLRPAGFTLRWTDLTALVGVGGLWLGGYLGRLEHASAPWSEGARHASL